MSLGQIVNIFFVGNVLVFILKIGYKFILFIAGVKLKIIIIRVSQIVFHMINRYNKTKQTKRIKRKPLKIIKNKNKREAYNELFWFWEIKNVEHDKFVSIDYDQKLT